MNLNDRIKHTLHTYGEWILYALIAGVLLFTCGQAAPAQCLGTYQVALSKDSTITVPCPDMVLMNLGTFTGYYETRQRYEALKIKIPEFQAVVDSVQTALSANISDLKSALELEQGSKQKAMKAALKLEKENKKLRLQIKVTKWLAIGGLGYVGYVLILE